MTRRDPHSVETESRLDQNLLKTLLMLFDGHRASLNKGVLVMVILPMTLVAVPITLMMVVPLLIVPIAVPSILGLDRWQR
jgi:hypothetical protein